VASITSSTFSASHSVEQPWLWTKARTAKRARTRFFEHIRTITAYLVFPDWTTLMQTLIDSKPPPHVEAQLAP
jgi:hypothetical protein